LSSKLPYILKWTDLRIQCADLYDELLKNCEGVVIPRRRDSTKHTFHLYVIRAKNRDGLVNYLKEKQIETAIHYPTALPNLKAYSYLGNEPEDFPIATAYQEQILSLPIYPELSKEQIAYVSENIVSFYS
jgi:dTDP-4-amino-4,6-dideoxygalactose transaminase